MRAFREYGLISNYEDYLNLPGVVADYGRLLMEAEATARQRESRRG